MICLVCTSGESTKRGYLAAEGFGSHVCHLEPEPRDHVSGFFFNKRSYMHVLLGQSSKFNMFGFSYVSTQDPCELWKCQFVIEDAMSVHAMYSQGLKTRVKVHVLLKSSPMHSCTTQQQLICTLWLAINWIIIDCH